jgi:hypothetical protein
MLSEYIFFILTIYSFYVVIKKKFYKCQYVCAGIFGLIGKVGLIIYITMHTNQVFGICTIVGNLIRFIEITNGI